jgi:cell wall-associated NlpC family hydrolase
MKTRVQAVAIARSWLGTPYVLGGRMKGAGCDCATLLAEYLLEVGRASEDELHELGFYSHDWFCHTTNERYLKNLMRYGRIVAEAKCRPGVRAQPGDLALFRTARSHLFNHGAIVTTWPNGIHAVDGMVRESDLSAHRLTGWKETAIFDPFVTLNREVETSGPVLL